VKFTKGQIVKWKNPNPDESPDDRMKVLWSDRDRTSVEMCGFDKWTVKPSTIVRTEDLEAA